MWKPLNTFTQKYWPPTRERTKKQEFLDKLKGETEVHIKNGTPVGTVFLVTDEGTGHMDNYFLIGPSEWISWGTSPKPDGKVTAQYTTRELELYLTDQMRKSRPDGKVTVLDESCCMEFCK